MANTYLHRTLGSTVTVTTITISCWVKRGSLGSTQRMFSHMIQNFAQYFYFRFNSDDTLGFASANSGNYNILFKTNRLFRDTNAWYHLVARIDTTAAGGNRVKIYVNGEQETSFSSSSEPDQNSTFYIGTTSDPMVVGGLYGNGYGISGGSTAEHFDGSMSHFHFIDGTAYDASAFGSTDATTGEWKINTSPSVTYGTNGFFILKDTNSSTDQSGNSNNFTVGGGTLTKTEDCPDNVFATWNPLDNGRTWSGTIGLKNGNTTQDNASDGSPISTLGMTSGKWYAEIKIVNGVNTRSIGIIDMASANSYIGHGSIAEPISYAYNTGSQSLWSGTTEVATSVGEGVAGDIISVLVDLDSATKTIKFKKNNVDLSGTTQLTISQSDITWGFVLRCDGGQIMSANFGNGFYGTTAVATNSGNGYSGAEGKSIFTYQPPTGYSALSTRGLNE